MKKVKGFIKNIIHPDILRYLKMVRHKLMKYHALDKLDQKMEVYLNYENGFFVELGANDGITNSNTLYFERHKKWHGILIEPTPNNYLLCRRNRSRKSKVFCYACTSFEYKEKFVEIAFSNLWSTPVNLKSDIQDPVNHAEYGSKELEPTDDVFIFGAVAKPLNNIFLEADAPKIIDFLSLDVEGVEEEVLKGIDHQQFRFKYILIESRDKNKLTTYLNSVGYEYVKQLSRHDHLFHDRKLTLNNIK